jgi:adenosylhomocysteine nucleosidase
MRILVTFAVEAEFAAWQKLRSFNPLDYQGLKIRKTRIGAADVWVLITGVGTQAASRSMDLMLGMADKNQYFDVCISSGLAGALCDSLNVGDIVAPRELLAEMQDSTHESGRLEVDSELRKTALTRGAKDANCLFTTDEILVKASQKKSCASGAQSVDMESFEIIRQATAWGARSVVIRAISDSATEDLPINFNRTLSDKNEVSLGKVFVEVLKNPLALPALIRFGRQSQQAGARLAAFLENYLLEVTGQEMMQRAQGVNAA